MTGNNSHTSRRKFLKTTGSVGLAGIAGCLGDGGTGGGSDGSGDGSDLDFGGQEIEVITNLGEIIKIHEQTVIPRVEEKYNLTVNNTSGPTAEMVTKIKANPDNPPDVVQMDTIGPAQISDMLEPIEDHTDIVTRYDKVADALKAAVPGSSAVPWVLGQVCPAVNTDLREVPSSWEETATEAEKLTMMPFSWSFGPVMVLLADRIATGTQVTADTHNIDEAFTWLEETVVPTYNNTYSGVSNVKNQVASGTADTTFAWWSYYGWPLFNQDQPVEQVLNPDPVGLATANTIAVASGSENVEAGMAYIQETLHPDTQRQAMELMGSGPITPEDVEIPSGLQEYGVTTPSDLESLTWPPWEYILANKDDWSDRWDTLFGGGG